MKNNTRWQTIAILTALVGATLAACSPDTSKESDDTFKIGILAPYTGVFAAYGPKVIEEPIRLYLEQHQNKIGGRQVELVKEDGQGEPSVVLQKAKKLVQQDKVDVIVGLVNSAGALAIRDFVDSSKAVTIATVAGAKELTASKSSPYVFRVGFATDQLGAAGVVLGEGLGIKNVATIGADYVAGREMVEDYVAPLKKSGGTIKDQQWPPLGTKDFGPYLAKMKQVADQVDVFSPVLFGADSVRFFQQYQSFGLKVPLYTNGDVTEQSIFLDNVQDAAIGTKTFWNYSPYLDNPVNNKFREGYLAKYKRLPGAFSFHSYSSMLFLDKAVAAIKGKAAPRGDTLADALAKTQIDSPAGQLSFDKGHGLIMSIYLNEIKKGPDGIVAQMPVGPKVTEVHQGMTYEEAKANFVPK